MRLPPTPRPLALAAALLLALPACTWAQSLQELYDAARAYDATYLAAKANAASVEYRAAQSEALMRPSLAATAGASTSQTDPPNIGTKGTNTVQGGLNGRVPLFNRASGATIEQARKSLITAQADLETAEQDLIVRVAQAYFDVLAAQDTLATTRANKAATSEQLASAKRNFEVGTATITDTREAQARFDLGTFQELFAENDLRTKRLALDTLVGRSAVEPRPLLVPVLLPAPVPANPEEWVTLADQGHPAVRRARIGLEVAQLETIKARAGDSPTVDAVGSLSASNNRGSLPELNRSTGTTAVASLGVQLNWPLYTGGATQARIKETLALEEKSRNDLEAARRSVVQGTRSTYFGVQSGLSQVKALEAAESSSALALEATQLGYKVGVRVNLDVLNAQLQLFQTRRDLAKARYDVLVGSLRLRQAAGQLSPADIDAVNRLLAK
ncbi:MAG: TolC family outer membrane protein [Betaproteobacteria bacterium]|nr:TolC family outer membrane protein [Betaproteobacteria bacterium]